MGKEEENRITREGPRINVLEEYGMVVTLFGSGKKGRRG